MRPEFAPDLNGAWDKLHRYHREAATDTALRQRPDARQPGLKSWWGAWPRRIRQALHLRPSPSKPTPIKPS